MKRILYTLFNDRWSLFFFTLLVVDMVFKIQYAGSHGFFFGAILEIILLFLINSKKSAPKLVLNNNKIVHFLVLMVFLCYFFMLFCHIITGETVNVRVLYVFFNFLFFLYFAFFTKINNLDCIGWSIKIVTIIGSLSVLLITKGNTDTAWRGDALIDKGFLTIFFAISFCLCITDVMFRKNVTTNLLLFVFLLYINMFFIQSKTAFVSMVLYIFIMMFLLKGRIRLYLLIGVTLCSVLILLNSGFFLSDSMANAINVVLNDEFFSLDAKIQQHHMGTFDMRKMITSYSIMLFLKSPLWGIGIGGFREQGGYLGVTECESSYLDMLVEGGLLYFIPVFLIISIPYIRQIYLIKKKQQPSYQSFWTVSVMTCILICFYWNDFLLPFVFGLIGICFYIVFNNTKPIKNF